MSKITSKSEETKLERTLRMAESNKEGTYEKRTEHLNSDGTAVFINRLVQEDSPYLLQHAHNPVNWLPWGEEAFEVSRSLNRPIFLSIGYSTCHWCHVMAHESFEDKKTYSYALTTTSRYRINARRRNARTSLEFR